MCGEVYNLHSSRINNKFLVCSSLHLEMLQVVMNSQREEE